VKEKTKINRFGNNLFRHVVIGLEIIPVKYFSLQVSYNYNVRQEMKAYEKPGAIGLAYGAGIHVAHFDLYYARNHNNLASVPNHFTLSTNIAALMKAKENKVVKKGVKEMEIKKIEEIKEVKEVEIQDKKEIEIIEIQAVEETETEDFEDIEDIEFEYIEEEEGVEEDEKIEEIEEIEEIEVEENK
jgi:hypothetical protein